MNLGFETIQNALEINMKMPKYISQKIHEVLEKNNLEK